MVLAGLAEVGFEVVVGGNVVLEGAAVWLLEEGLEAKERLKTPV